MSIESELLIAVEVTISASEIVIPVAVATVVVSIPGTDVFVPVAVPGVEASVMMSDVSVAVILAGVSVSVLASDISVSTVFRSDVFISGITITDVAVPGIVVSYIVVACVVAAYVSILVHHGAEPRLNLAPFRLPRAPPVRAVPRRHRHGRGERRHCERDHSHLRPPPGQILDGPRDPRRNHATTSQLSD